MSLVHSKLLNITWINADKWINADEWINADKWINLDKSINADNWYLPDLCSTTCGPILAAACKTNVFIKVNSMYNKFHHSIFFIIQCTLGINCNHWVVWNKLLVGITVKIPYSCTPWLIEEFGSKLIIKQGLMYIKNHKKSQIIKIK